MSSWIGVKRWCDFGANLVQHFMLAYSRYSRYQTVLSKLEEIISTFGRIQKMLRFFRGIFYYLFENNELPYRSWIGLRHELNLRFVNCLRHWRNRAIQFMKSKISNHEAARLQFMTACRQFITFPAVLFTFYMFYGIIISGNYLLDKLEYVDYFLRRRQSVYCI